MTWLVGGGGSVGGLVSESICDVQLVGKGTVGTLIPLPLGDVFHANNRRYSSVYVLIIISFSALWS